MPGTESWRGRQKQVGKVVGEASENPPAAAPGEPAREVKEAQLARLEKLRKKIKEDFVKKMTMSLIFSVILVLKLLAVWVHLEEQGRFESFVVPTDMGGRLQLIFRWALEKKKGGAWF
ncbi:UNVERIFIED_CONTAM: hypothetical protein K2H54_043492 [Gekko kuhli]